MRKWFLIYNLVKEKTLRGDDKDQILFLFIQKITIDQLKTNQSAAKELRK